MPATLSERVLVAHLRRLIASVFVLLLALVSGLASPSHAAPASTDNPGTSTAAASSGADEGYTYWGFYEWNDKKLSWDYMTVGANDKTAVPEDGDVYGFRWALVVKEPRLPRADGDFDAICGAEDAASGQKRVAFVVDYGSESDAVGDDQTPQPRGVCAAVDESFTAQQALQGELPVRTGNGGLVCGIDDYPSQECGDVVANPEEPPADEQVDLVLPSDESSDNSGEDGSSDSTRPLTEDSDDSSNLLTIGIPVAVVALLAVGALVLRRRQA